MVLRLLHGPFLELGLDLPHEGRTDPLLKLVRRCVEVEDLDDLGHPELVAHVADPGDVFLRLASLEELGGLDDRQEGVDDLGAVVLQVLVPGPLFQLSYVVPGE